MAKLTAWTVTILGLILAINASGTYTTPYTEWLMAIGVLVIGIGKLVRNYNLFK